MSKKNTALPGRILPQSKDLEKKVLGALLLDKNAINVCLELIPDMEFFYDERHQHIYQAILNLFQKDFDIDISTATQQLRENGKMELVGGPIYVVELTSHVNSGLHIESHIRKLQEAYIKRKIIQATEQLMGSAFDVSVDALEALATTQTEIMKLSEMLDRKSEHSMFQIVYDCLSDIETKSKANEITGIPSAIRAINNVMAGYQDSDLIILAARPAMGKTAFALNEARTAAIIHKIPVGIFSLEMGKVQLGKRLISSETLIDSNTIKRPSTLTAVQWHSLSSGTSKLANAPIYVDDTAGLTILQLRAKAARMVVKYGIRLFIVDYLQLIKNPAYKNREQEISSIARELKLMAKDLNVPVIALSQLSRAVEGRADKTPMLSDLRESGAIEQDADIIAFLMRPEYYHITEDEEGFPTAGLTKYIIAKHRNGDLDEIWVDHDLEHNLYGDLGTIHKKSNDGFGALPPPNFDDDNKPF